MAPNQTKHFGGKKKNDLVNMRSLAAREPATGTGKVMWIWPEIEEALATGKKLREVWEAADADGLSVPYPQFRVYVSRLRSRTLRQQPPPPAVIPGADAQPGPQAPAHPLSNLRLQREKKESDGFTYNPFSNQKQLID